MLLLIQLPKSDLLFLRLHIIAYNIYLRAVKTPSFERSSLGKDIRVVAILMSLMNCLFCCHQMNCQYVVACSCIYFNKGIILTFDSSCTAL